MNDILDLKEDYLKLHANYVGRPNLSTKDLDNIILTTQKHLLNEVVKDLFEILDETTKKQKVDDIRTMKYKYMKELKNLTNN